MAQPLLADTPRQVVTTPRLDTEAVHAAEALKVVETKKFAATRPMCTGTPTNTSRARFMNPDNVVQTFEQVVQDMKEVDECGSADFKATLSKVLRDRAAPMLLLRVRELRDFGGLPSYEEVELSLTNFSEISDDDLVVFVCHRWWKPGSPDGEDDDKVNHLLEILPDVHEAHGVPGKIYIWWDTFSMCKSRGNVHHVERSAQILALPLYLAASDVCVAIKADSADVYSSGKADPQLASRLENRLWIQAELWLFTATYGLEISAGRCRKRILVELALEYDSQRERFRDSHSMDMDAFAKVKRELHDSSRSCLPTLANIADQQGLDDVQSMMTAISAKYEDRLLIACHMSFVYVVYAFLKLGDSPNTFGKLGYTPLMECIGENGDAIEVLKMLIEFKAELNSQHPSLKVSALHQAVAFGLLDCTSILLDASANPNLQDKKGRTPLHVAARFAPENVAQVLVQKLLDKKADPTVIDISSKTAADVATTRGNHVVKGMLLDVQLSMPGAEAVDVDKADVAIVETRTADSDQGENHPNEIASMSFREAAEWTNGSNTWRYTKFWPRDPQVQWEASQAPNIMIFWHHGNCSFHEREAEFYVEALSATVWLGSPNVWELQGDWKCANKDGIAHEFACFIDQVCGGSLDCIIACCGWGDVPARLAASQPTLVRSLVAVGVPYAMPIGVRRELLELTSILLNCDETSDSLGKVFATIVFGRQIPETKEFSDLIAELMEIARSMRSHDRQAREKGMTVLEDMFNSVFVGDSSGLKWDEIKQPMLCIAGVEDDAFIAEVEHLSLLAPKAQLVYIPDAGHCPQVEAPKLYREAVQSFVKLHFSNIKAL